MWPVTFISFLLSLTLPALANDPPKNGSNGTVSILECYTITDVINSFSIVNLCFHDIVKVFKNETAVGTCKNIGDLIQRYNELVVTVNTKCPDVHFGPDVSSVNTSVTDVLSNALDSNNLREFIKNDGMNCLHSISKPVRHCREKTIVIKADLNPFNDTTPFSFWKRTKTLTLDANNCHKQKSFRNCTQNVLEENCNKQAINYFTSIFDVFKIKCKRVIEENKKNIAKRNFNPPSKGSTTAYWIVGVMLVAVIVAVSTICIKKRQSQKKETAIEMR